MTTLDSNESQGNAWPKRMLARLRRMVARLRGQEAEAPDWERHDLSADDLDRILAQVAPPYAPDASCAEASVKRYVSYVSRHPADRNMQGTPEKINWPPSPETDSPPAEAKPNVPATGSEIQRLESARDSIMNTADVLRKVAEQMRRNVESQKRVNEKLADLRDRIRESTERMKRRRANFNLKKALNDQTAHAGPEPDGIDPNAADSESGNLPPNETPPPPGGRIPYHERIELTGLAEYEKFARMGPITDDDVRRVREAQWWVTD